MSVASSTWDLVTSGPLMLAAPVALAAGVLSFFSPCCLPLLPGYLSYVTGSLGADAVQSGPPVVSERSVRSVRVVTSRRTMVGSLFFVLGFAAVFTSYGAAFGGLGTLLQSHQQALIRVLGGFTIVLGLLFAGVLVRFPWANRSLKLPFRPSMGVAGAPVLGILFGLGWTPCIGPTLAAVLSLATTTQGAWRGAALAFVYSLGLGVPFLVAAASADRAMAAYGWPRRHAAAVMRLGGLMLVLVGVLQVTGAWGAMIVHLQGLVGGFQLLL
ncbi:MAG: cytochrome c biogenesis protein CcdA [Actinomycetota bacterium]